MATPFALSCASEGALMLGAAAESRAYSAACAASSFDFLAYSTLPSFVATGFSSGFTTWICLVVGLLASYSACSCLTLGIDFCMLMGLEMA